MRCFLTRRFPRRGAASASGARRSLRPRPARRAGRPVDAALEAESLDCPRARIARFGRSCSNRRLGGVGLGRLRLRASILPAIGLAVFTCVGLLGTVALEVGGVPARALELEAGGRDLLGERRCAAGRAHGQRGIGELLQHVFGVTAEPRTDRRRSASPSP